jgi:2-polyprenyl-6-methoxyphenol hydroxylase-like FAD-dependent oxidoreductase
MCWRASSRPAGGDHLTAFARYQERLIPFLKRKQASAARFASSFAPTSTLGLRVRDLVTRLFRIPLVADLFIGRGLRDDIALADYRFERAVTSRGSGR